MDEKDYELLHALDETRNITHAADKLYMTQSALSKRIKALEQELGVEIVLRSRQGIRFTPAGEQVLLHSAAAAREMEKMRRQLASIQGEACGTLRAGISVNFSYYRLPEVLTEYHKAYPKVRLDIATGHSRNIYQQMLDSSLDVAVLRGEYPWDRPAHHRLERLCPRLSLDPGSGRICAPHRLADPPGQRIIPWHQAALSRADF